MEQESPEKLASRLEAKLGEQGIVGRVVPANLKHIVADAPPKFFLRDQSDQLSGFVLCSSPHAPDLIARGVRRAEEARQALGPELGKVVLMPTQVGSLDGLSFALLPYRDPISSNRIARYFQRRGIGPQLLEWLSLASLKTITPASEDEIETVWQLSLERIAREKFARHIAPGWLSQLRDSAWNPQFVLAHNDLWIGNVLRAPRGARWPFVIVDWLGSEVRGFPIFDSIRIAESLAISPKALRDELRIHCDALGCDLEHAGVYLLAALGRIGLNLEQFPRERFASMAESCWRTFTAACR